MDKNKITPRSIWEEYEKDLAYKNSLDLFEKTNQHQNFFLGKQWEGLNAPDLEKPVLNFIKRVVNYLMSVLMVNDIAISVKAGMNDQLIVKALENEIEKINEASRFKTKLRNIIKATAIDGDGAMYVRYNPETDMVESELVHCTDLVFGDRTTPEVEKQPYIIIVQKLHNETFKNRYPKAEREYNFTFGWQDDDNVTVLTRLYKKNGTVHFVQSTQHQLLCDETDTGQKLYPVAFMNWEAVRGSYHGMGAVETIIPNQIAVNKLWAMALLYQKNNAFPKIFVDKTKLDKWNSSPGAIMGVVGNPNEAVATSFRAGDMASQLMNLVEKTISYTKDLMGANDAALGNVSPNNTSAIVTLQKASVAPLELQRQALYQFVEDYSRIVFDIIKAFYGAREIELEDEIVYVDFDLVDDNAKIMVDVGQSEYWSETAQMNTMDNLFSIGVIDDAMVYLENIPNRALPNKNKLMKQLQQAKEKREAEALQLAEKLAADKDYAEEFDFETEEAMTDEVV